MIHGGDLYGIRNKHKAAIERIQTFEPSDGYFIAFSGGKDSQTIYHLAKEAGVKFDAHYHLTTVDPPELVRFIKRQYPDVIIDKPEMSMWQLIVKKHMPPNRKVRYCCDVLKESNGTGRTVMTEVRWEESARRKDSRAMLELCAYTSHKIMLNNDNDESRRMMETCIATGKKRHILNPIIDWTEAEVWEYLDGNNIPHCSLYDEGFKRLGCIGCPLSGKKNIIRDFERWPKYKTVYLHAFERMLADRERLGKPNDDWADANAVMEWFINSDAEGKDETMPGRGGGDAVNHSLEDYEESV